MANGELYEWLGGYWREYRGYYMVSEVYMWSLRTIKRRQGAIYEVWGIMRGICEVYTGA